MEAHDAKQRRHDGLWLFVLGMAGVGVFCVCALIAVSMMEDGPIITYEVRNKAARVLVMVIPTAESLGVTGLLVAIGRSRGGFLRDDRWLLPIVGLAFTAGAIVLYFMMKRLLAGGMP